MNKTIKIENREYPLDGLKDIINTLVEKGDLIKKGDSYFWSKKHFKNKIRALKHIRRYIDYGWYRFLTKIYRSIRDIFLNH